MGSKLGTVNCYSCDSNHQDVDLHDYDGQRPDPYTHWFKCPKTGDPVGVCVRVFNGIETALNDKLVTELLKMQQCGRGFLVAFITPQAPGPHGEPNVLVDRIAEKFPHDHFPAAIETFKANLMQEVGPPKDKPMEIAPPLPDRDEPLAQLFGPPQDDSPGHRADRDAAIGSGVVSPIGYVPPRPIEAK
jgi:hypothetical protein